MAAQTSNKLFEAALDLTRRLPPENIEENLFFLLDLVPDLTESLLSTIDQPLKAAPDQEAGRDYLLCDYNRDGDSFRSPWSNKYNPPLEDGSMPSYKLREMESLANRVFERYRDVYFGAGSISSVYYWDLTTDEELSGWAACVLMYKEGPSGVWNSIHVVEVVEKPGQKQQPQRIFKYKLTTTIMLTLKNSAIGEGSLSGSLTRQEIKEFPNPKDDPMVHIANYGRMVEELESRLRNLVDVVYFGKTQEVFGYIREIRGVKDAKERQERQKQVVSEMSKPIS
jgi:capping protein beta